MEEKEKQEHVSKLMQMYHQAVFQVMQQSISTEPINAWIGLLMGGARGWCCVREYTTYTIGALKLQVRIMEVISRHPSNPSALPLEYVAHPGIMVLEKEEYESALLQTLDAWYFDAAVEWFEQIGIVQRLALDFTDLLLTDLRVLAIVCVDLFDATLELFSDEPCPVFGKLRRDTHEKTP